MQPYKLKSVFEFCRKVTVSKRWRRKPVILKLKPEETKSSWYYSILTLAELPLILP